MPSVSMATAAGIGVALVTAVVTTATARPASAAGGPPGFASAVHLPGTAGRTEPRLTFDAAGNGAVITSQDAGNNSSFGNAIVFSSGDHGGTWTQTPGEPSTQTLASTDVDMVALTAGTHAGRLIASELDYAGSSIRTSYSDDGGRTWTAASGTGLVTGTGYADTDREWLATGGPVDPATGEQDVYLLFHNGDSGIANQNMFVAKSADGGVTWGPPVPITLPGSQAYADLQCGDSNGPSDVFVDPATGRIYATWDTGSAQPPLQSTGGCGAVTGSGGPATRVWVAVSATGDAGTWHTSLAVDDNPTGQIVGMQFSPGAIDSAGNVYIAYAESPGQYPNYDGAAIRLVYNTSPILDGPWSAPITVEAGAADASASATAATPGNVLPHIVAGGPGEVALAYFHGFARAGTTPGWNVREAETLNALASNPSFTKTDISTTPLPASPGSTQLTSQDMTVATGTASQLMGLCGGATCNRSADVWGAAIDPTTCYVSFTWPAASSGSGLNDSFYASDPSFYGSYVSTQTSGAPLCTPKQPAP